MRIYNARNIDSGKRFIIALICGFIAAVICALLFGMFVSLSPFIFSVFYIGIGWAISQVIREIGRGVTLRFAVAGAALTAFAIILADTLASFGVRQGLTMAVTPSMWLTLLRVWFRSHISFSFNNLLGLLFRGFGVYYAFYNSRIL